MSTDAKARYAAAGFVVLLLLSVLWPSPIVSVNLLWTHRPLDVDELSFLGREAPSWDVVFWCIAGLFAIALLQSADAPAGEARDAVRALRRLRIVMPGRFAIALVASIVLIALTWLAADSLIVAAAERAESPFIDDWIRIFNRLGGGINPPMIVLFFVIAGIAYRRRQWSGYGVAMAMAGISAGIFAQIIKFAVGRTRPELWLGPFHYIRASAASFPSGHTVAAFSLAGVLLIGSRNVPLRIAALLLACAVAAARVFAFRHWPSDVVASALIGLMAAWIAVRSIEPHIDDLPAG